MRHASAPELRSWLALQGFQEAVHTDSYVVISEEIGLDPDEVFTRYLTNPALYAKIAMCGRYSEMLDGLTDLGDPEQMEKFIVAYAFFALILESIWFYVGLSAGTYPTRFLGKMNGTADMFSFIRKDECVVEGTEVLTKSGWLPVEQLSMDTELLQWHEDNTTSWTLPTKLSTHQADSYYSFDLATRGFKQKVSAEHRFPYYVISGRLKIVPAREATPNVYTKHPMAGRLRSVGAQDSLTPKERFLVALQADGSLPSDRYTGERCGTVPYLFSLTKGRKRSAFEKILADLGWGYGSSIDKIIKIRNCEYIKTNVQTGPYYVYTHCGDCTNTKHNN
jgi:ribonucleotide reductase beta subunit family protein with ferritin-like domain